MTIKNVVRSQKMPLWAVKVEDYLLLLQKDELLDLLRTAGQTVSTLKHKPPEKIRQSLLSLPQDSLGSALSERMRRLRRPWRDEHHI